METAADRLRAARKFRMLNQAQLASLANVATGTIGNIEAGSRSIDRSAVRLAMALGISAEWLATGEGEMLPAHGLIREPSNIEPGPEIKGRGRYPVLSEVQAGNWREVCGDTHATEEWGVSHHDLGECGYMLRVAGNSMTNTESGARYSFPEGMLLHVNPHAEALPGKFVIVRRESEKAVTFKRLQIMDGELYLEAINPSWPTRYIKLKPGDEICGVVVDASFGGLP